MSNDLKFVEPLRLKNESRFSSFFHCAAFGAARLDVETSKILEANDTLCVMTGYTRQELLEHTLRDLTHPEDRDHTVHLLEQQNATSPGFRQIEKRIVRRDGQYIWVHVAKHLVLDEKGDPEFFAGIIIDITESKKSVEQLAQKTEALRLSQEAGNVGSYDWDIQTDKVIWSEMSELLFGLSPDSFGGTAEHWRKMVHPSDLEKVETRLAEAFARREKDWDAEYRILLNDGSTRWIESKAQLTYNPDGLPLRMFGISVDVTDRKRADEALRRSEAEARARAEELAAILEAVPGMTFIALDTQCLRMISSRAAYDLLRLPHGANTSKSAPENERPTNFRAMKDGREIPAHELPVQWAAATGKAVRDCELTLEFDDGSSRHILGSAVPLLDPQGAVRGAVGSFMDITERKRLEEMTIREEIQRQLLQHEILAREEERKRLARELHDESGQMLASLLAGLRLIEDARSLKAAQIKVKALRQLASRTIDELGRLARDLHPAVLDDLGLKIALEQYVSEYSSFHEIQTHLRIMGFGSTRLPRDMEQGIYRVVQEALTNVAKHARAKTVSLHIYLEPEQLTMTICDDGQGFSTTAATTRGPQPHLGIPGMRERVSMLGGAFQIESQVGAGTRIVVKIPILKPSAAVAQDASA